MNRYTKSFSLTLILYIIIFFSFSYSLEEKNPLKSTQKKSEQIVKFTIIQEPTPVEKKKKEIVKKTEIKKVITKKLSHKKIEPKEIETKKKETTKKKEIKKTKQIIVKQQIKKNKSLKKHTINHLDKLRKQKENQNKYYSQIKEMINKNKTYPRMAIKRGIEGTVKIKFTISKEGKLLSFNVIEGKRVFKKSISEAIKNSFPLSPPKDTLTSNTSLSLMINYRLY